MHPMAIVGGGFILLAAFVFVGRSADLPAANIALAFIPFWFAAVFAASRFSADLIDAKVRSLIAILGVPTLAALYLWWTYSAA